MREAQKMTKCSPFFGIAEKKSILDDVLRMEVNLAVLGFGAFGKSFEGFVFARMFSLVNHKLVELVAKLD